MKDFSFINQGSVSIDLHLLTFKYLPFTSIPGYTCSMSLILDALILNRHVYLDQIQRLAVKAKQEKRLLKSSPVVEGLDLFSVLSHADMVVDKIIYTLQQSTLKVEASKLILLETAPGKVRKIDILPWPEKILLMGFQRTLADAFQPLFSKKLYSFIKKRSNMQAKVILLDFLKKNKICWVAKRDISGYGDNIPKDILLQKISLYLNAESNPISQRLITYAVGDKPVGIPTGSPLTPIFENIYLMELDKLSEQYPANELFYARYGDDFVFAAPSQALFEEFELKSSIIIEELKLSVAPHKKINMLLKSTTQNFDWLGSKFSGNGVMGTREKHVNQFNESYRKKIKKLVIRLAKTKKIDQAMPILALALNTYLSGKSNGALSTLIYHRTDPRDVKKIDQQIRLLLTNWIRKYFKINRRQAWKNVRQLEIKSLNFQRRKLCRLQKFRIPA